jgi:hypothetical protein
MYENYRRVSDWRLDLLDPYSANANFYTLQITKAHTKSFLVCNVFTSCLVTAPIMAIPLLLC